MANTTWGASRGAWTHFAETLGLTADLLPVAADPNAPISELSKMKDRGKTPSQYNRDRKIAGIPKWTQHEASKAQIARWAGDTDLGICVQTRRMRAIDVDVVDVAQAAEVGRVIDAFMCSEDLPDPARRTRGNSPKFLVPIWLDGAYVKRIIRTAHGIIEFLATGQQFVAVSTHPSGGRYEWSDGEVPMAESIPRLTPDQFERLWALLQERFGIAPGTEARRGGAQPSRPRSLDDAQDTLLGYLEAKGWVVDYQHDGRVDVRCPWEAEHTTDSGSSSTTYFPAGVGGFQQGHWRCLHAHCAQRTDGDFLEAIGYNTEDFPLMLTQAEHDALELTDGVPEGVEVQIVEAGATGSGVEVTTVPMPKFKRDGRTGKIKAIIENLILALGDPRVAGGYLGYDAFTDTVMLAPADIGEDGAVVPVPVHQRQWVPMTDARRVELRLHLERGAAGFEPLGKENMRDAMDAVAERCRFDSAIEWLRHRVPRWDGVKRIDAFLPRYFNAEDNPYHRAIGAYIWTAMAGRVLDPGCKADMVPLLIGEGGSGKTTGVAAMAPSVETAAEISLAVRDEDLSRKLRGVLVGEIGELRGLATRDRESILAWITRTHEVWTPKFKEYGTRFARRCLFIGTTNKEQPLADDEAGLRRWLPVHVGLTDLDALVADREQLWAEARERWLAGGVEWEAANRLAKVARLAATEHDPWLETVRAWLLDQEFGEGDEPGVPRFMLPFNGAMVAAGALGLSAKSFGRAEQNRLGGVLRALGCKRASVRIGGVATQGYKGNESAILCTDHASRTNAASAVDELL